VVVGGGWWSSSCISACWLLATIRYHTPPKQSLLRVQFILPLPPIAYPTQLLEYSLRSKLGAVHQ